MECEKEKITREEFETFYASQMGITVDDLHKENRYAIACNCDYEACQGWQIRNLVDLVSSDYCRVAEYIPEDWNMAELFFVLENEGKSELAEILRKRDKISNDH